MLPAAAAPASSTVAQHDRPTDRPPPYSPIPQRLIADLHDNPLAIGLYGLIARLYLVTQMPIPLSVPDVLRFDPALSRGAVLRALARLLKGGYLIDSAQLGHKTRYTPTWGRVAGSPLPWNMEQPCLGRPRHVARLRLDRRLFDICMGKLTPHASRAAVITRYVTAPILSLTDVGCYMLTLAGVPRPTPALIRLGAVRDGEICPLPSDQQLLALISQRALDLCEQSEPCIELTSSGSRRLGLQAILVPNPAAATAQPLFFVPPRMIGTLIHPLIGSMIGPDTLPHANTAAAASGKTRLEEASAGITRESWDQGDVATPPLRPPQQPHDGGGEVIGHTIHVPRQPRNAEPLPNTESAIALQAINVKPTQIIELAHMPLATVETAILDGRARSGIRDLAGWVVSLLRTHRDYGWKITPPAPAAYAPEALREALARYAAEQDQASYSTDHVNQVDSGAKAKDAVPHQQEPHDQQSLDLLWNDIQTVMAERITRQEFKTWIQPAVLCSINQATVTIGVPNARIKEELERRYTALLRDLFGVALGAPTQIRVLIRKGTRGAADNTHVPTDVPKDSRSPVAVSEAPGSDRRPAWIDAERWVTLPTMLRAALIGSTLEEGILQPLSPHIDKFISMRYSHEVATLIAAVAKTRSGPV